MSSLIKGKELPLIGMLVIFNNFLKETKKLLKNH